MTQQVTTTLYGLHYKFDCDDAYYVYKTDRECEAQKLQIALEHRDNYVEPDVPIQDVVDDWAEFTDYEENFLDFHEEITSTALTNQEQILLEEVLASVSDLLKKHGPSKKSTQLEKLLEALVSADTIILE